MHRISSFDYLGFEVSGTDLKVLYHDIHEVVEWSTCAALIVSPTLYVEGSCGPCVCERVLVIPVPPTPSPFNNSTGHGHETTESTYQIYS